MNCPNCKEDNPNEAYYCHICGNKLKSKFNGWMICSIILFLLTCILGVGLVNSSNRIDFLSREYNGQWDRINDLTNQLQEKDEQISKLESETAETAQFRTRINSLTRQLNEKAEEIERLKAQLPQFYYTKYDNQSLYYKSSSGYDKASLLYSEKGTYVTIYSTNSGYGLTDYGWIPMNCLEKY